MQQKNKYISMLYSTMKMFYGKIFLWYAHILCILSKIMLLLSCKPFNYSRSSPYSDSLTWQLYITTFTYYPFLHISLKFSALLKANFRGELNYFKSPKKFTQFTYFLMKS